MASPDTDDEGLARALVNIGVELASAGGPDAVSLREVQRRANVSHYAAYRHFPGRPAFLAAVASEAAARVAAELTQRIVAVGVEQTAAATARARFTTWAVAYIDVAVEQPGLFQAAFTAGSASPGEPEPGQPSGDLSWDVYRLRIDELVASGALQPSDQRSFALTSWSAVHGLAVIVRDGPLARLDRGARSDAVGLVLRALLSLLADGDR